MIRVAVIGLGNMGLPMAERLAAAGHQVLGADVSEAALARARAAGVPLAQDAVAAAEASDVALTMLPNGDVLRSLADVLPSAVGAGGLWIDASTVDPASARAAAAAAAAAGVAMLDAPVSGGVGGAASGALTFMVGGDADAVARAAPLFDAMGKKTVHCGGVGAGQAAKICNNMVLGISMLAVSEAFVLADGLGLDRQALYDVASTSSGQCWSLTTYCPAPGVGPTTPADDGYRPGFAAALMRKDLGLAAEAAGAAGVDTPLGAAAAGLYDAFVAQDRDDLDFSAVLPWLAAGRPTP